MSATHESRGIGDLVANARVIVCCGAGGVGKTTTATALAIAGARAGRRVLALTVDPSRRLAETLGVATHLREPVSPPADRLAAAGIQAPGSLETWMLDAQLVADEAVARLASSPESAARLRANRVYKGVSRMVAGMQEYTAMEALSGFLASGRYDLVVLDTPPAKNALDFLEGPARLAEFFDGRIFQLFLPSNEGGLLERGASRLLGRALSAVFGAESYAELQTFFAVFAPIFAQLNGNAGATRKLLSDARDVGFLLVTSPAPEAVADALFFLDKTRELALPFRAFVLNRSDAASPAPPYPGAEVAGPGARPALLSGLAKLAPLADAERAKRVEHETLLADLAKRAAPSGTALALPTMAGGANEMATLVALADRLSAHGR